MLKKSLLIGLDGATWDLIKPWVEEGKLPTFRKLMEKGVWGYLESTIPPVTIPAWVSLSTGLNPGKLGFSNFLYKKGYEFKPYFTKWKEKRNIWDFLSFYGKRCCVVNLPNVIKGYSINGCLVPGWMYTGDFSPYPKEISNLLKEQEYMEAIKVETINFKKILNSARFFHNSFVKLLKDFLWDFSFIIYPSPDWVQHRMWYEEGKVLKIYEEIDRYIEKWIEKVGKEHNFIIVSDHGFGTTEIKFHINEWLIQEGYLVLKKDKRFNKQKIPVFLSLFLKIYGKIPLNIFNALRKKFYEFSLESIDWSKTTAFSYGTAGEIWINLKGREPNGIVKKEEYEDLTKEILSKLKKMKFTAYLKEEIYKSCSKFDELADIIICYTQEGAQSISPNLCGETFRNVKIGDHRLHGIFLAYGKDIKNTGEEIKNLKIYDIAPTILHMFGLPIPKDMDGRVLTEIFREESEIAKRKPVFVEPSYYSQKLKLISEKERIRERIRKLKDKGKV